MSSSSSTVEQTGRCNGSGGWNRLGRNGNWSGINIGALVVGFIVFGPLGLVILAWVLTGRDVRDLPDAVKHFCIRVKEFFTTQEIDASSNSVFNDYQETQYDRIREIKQEIKARAERFRAFKADVKRKADEEEFQRFMADFPEPR